MPKPAAVINPIVVSDQAALAELMKLEAWWFIANPLDPQSLFSDTFGKHGRCILAFRSEMDAMVAAHEVGAAADDRSILLLEMFIADVPAWARATVASGTARVAFDAMDGPCIVPLANIPGRGDAPPTQRATVAGGAEDDDIDALLATVAEIHANYGDRTEDDEDRMHRAMETLLERAYGDRWRDAITDATDMASSSHIDPT